LNFRNYSI